MSRNQGLSDEDKRTDKETRDRIDELTVAWENAVTALEARYRRVSFINHATAVIVLIVLAVCAITWKETNTSSELNRHALCTWRLDLEGRIERADEWLREHPDGIAGITPADIRISVDNQRRTVLSLGDLNCVKERNDRVVGELNPTSTATPSATVRKP